MNKKGFTLVEVGLVVMMIALLAAIAIHSFIKAKEESEKKAKAKLMESLETDAFDSPQTVIPKISVDTSLKIVAMGTTKDFTVYKVVDTSDIKPSKFYVVVGADTNSSPQKITLEKAE